MGEIYLFVAQNFQTVLYRYLIPIKADPKLFELLLHPGNITVAEKMSDNIDNKQEVWQAVISGDCNFCIYNFFMIVNDHLK